MSGTAKSYLIRVWTGASVAGILMIFLAISGGCSFPVRQQSDEVGKPIPLSVVVEPRKTQNGEIIPLPVADVRSRAGFASPEAAPTPLPKPEPGVDWLTLLAGIAATVGGGYGVWATRAVTVLKTAVKVASNHADRMEKAESEDEVREAKRLSMLEQEVRGVGDVIADLRGKPKKVIE